MKDIETVEPKNGNGLSKIVIAALLAGFVSFWTGFALRASETTPAYTKTEIDLMFLNVNDKLDGISNQISDLKFEVKKRTMEK